MSPDIMKEEVTLLFQPNSKKNKIKNQCVSLVTFSEY